MARLGSHNYGRVFDPRDRQQDLRRRAHRGESAAFYTTGGHGYGLHCLGDARAWPDATLKWLQKVVPAFGK